MQFVGSLICFAFIAVSQTYGAGTCQNGRVVPTTFSTNDAFFHQSSTFIVEFALACDNEVSDLSLYAEMNGQLMPVAVSEESGRYQVSWTLEHEKAFSGAYTVNVYDEDGYAAVRKAQRNNEDVSKVKSLGQAVIQHPGPSKGPLVTTENLVLALSIALMYFAHTWKSNIQA